jgi:hypothetical protein
MAVEIFSSDDLAITAVGQLGSLSLDLEHDRIAV